VSLRAVGVVEDLQSTLQKIHRLLRAKKGVLGLFQMVSLNHPGWWWWIGAERRMRRFGGSDAQEEERRRGGEDVHRSASLVEESLALLLLWVSAVCSLFCLCEKSMREGGGGERER
jgi:hypothetical protein